MSVDFYEKQKQIFKFIEKINEKRIEEFGDIDGGSYYQAIRGYVSWLLKNQRKIGFLPVEERGEIFACLGEDTYPFEKHLIIDYKTFLQAYINEGYDFKNAKIETCKLLDIMKTKIEGLEE